MPTITIRLEDKQLKELQKLASDNNKTITDYVIGTVFNITTPNKKLTLEKVVKIALELIPDTEFSIPSLFTLDIWKSFNASEKRVVGRTFYKLVQDSTSVISKDFIFLGKTSNIAIYKRVEWFKQ